MDLQLENLEKKRSSLFGDDLKNFDTTLSKFKMEPDVLHYVQDFIDGNNFTIISKFNHYPHFGLVRFNNGVPCFANYAN